LWLIVSYLVVVFLVPLLLSAVVTYRSLPAGRHCPQCAGQTIPLVDGVLHRLHRLQRRGGQCVRRRWCLECGWEGYTREKRDRSSRPERSDRALPSYLYEAGIAETLDVRTITIDGRSWRVLLQCWNQTRVCCGRLVFVEPTGRLWTDACEAFTGASRFEVIGQALSVPDTLLTSRLRRILSEA
jgi:hypothetical protein